MRRNFDGGSPFSFLHPYFALAAYYYIPAVPAERFHQASMNGSIFRDAENEDGGVLAADCWRGEGNANRQDREEGRVRVGRSGVSPG